MTNKGLFSYTDMYTQFLADRLDCAVSVLDSVEMFNLTTHKWHDGVPLKSARYDHSSFVCNGELIIVGGSTHVEVFGNCLMPPIEVFRASVEGLCERQEIEPLSTGEQKVAAMAPRLNSIDCVEPPSQLWLDVSKLHYQ